MTFRLGHGDLLVMGTGSQRHWLHSVQPEEETGLRYNLTFRFYALEEDLIDPTLQPDDVTDTTLAMPASSIHNVVDTDGMNDVLAGVDKADAQTSNQIDLPSGEHGNTHR